MRVVGALASRSCCGGAAFLHSWWGLQWGGGLENVGIMGDSANYTKRPSLKRWLRVRTPKLQKGLKGGFGQTPGYKTGLLLPLGVGGGGGGGGGGAGGVGGGWGGWGKGGGLLGVFVWARFGGVGVDCEVGVVVGVWGGG